MQVPRYKVDTPGPGVEHPKAKHPNVSYLQLVPSEGAGWIDSKVHDLSPWGGKGGPTWVL